MIDIGTGDGLFVYHSALKNRSQFFIGLEPNIRPLEKISEKIHRNSKNGGAPNALYLRASIEHLPEELNGIANHIFVLFPWGSLLAAVLGEKTLLEQIRRLCSPHAHLEVVFSFDAAKDRSELERFGMDSFTADALEKKLIPAYHDAGFAVQLQSLSDSSGTPTTWGRRLAHNRERCFLKLSGHSLSKR